MPPVRRSIERKFLKNLRKAFQGLLDKISRGDKKPESIIRDIDLYMSRPEVIKYLARSVASMVNTERLDSARSWREQATRSTNGRKIYEAMRHEMEGPVGKRVYELVADNVRYFKSIPEEWAQYITQYVLQETLKGNRPDEIADELRKVFPNRIHNKLNLIARTESAKANSAIVQARAEMCGIKAYIWRSVKDARSRDPHKLMDGILVFYNDPPNPEALFPVPTGKYGRGKPAKPYGNYHAGNTFNCRCYQEPVVDMSFLPDRIDVHDHGRIIKNMSREQIQRAYGKIA